MSHRIALALAVALAAPCAALAQANGPGYAPAPVYAQPQQQRDSWYIGFGLGSGVGNVTVNGVSRSFSDVLRDNGTGDPVNFSLQFEVGATVRPDLLVGLDLRALRAQASASDGFGNSADLGIQSTQILAAMTWFPAERGFFLRGGAGLASITLDANSAGVRASDSRTGVGLLGGLGYAFWLGRHFNLTLNGDVSAQFYGSETNQPESSRVVDLYLGFTWY